MNKFMLLIVVSTLSSVMQGSMVSSSVSITASKMLPTSALAMLQNTVARMKGVSQTVPFRASFIQQEPLAKINKKQMQRVVDKATIPYQFRYAAPVQWEQKHYYRQDSHQAQSRAQFPGWKSAGLGVAAIGAGKKLYDTVYPSDHENLSQDVEHEEVQKANKMLIEAAQKGDATKLSYAMLLGATKVKEALVAAIQSNQMNMIFLLGEELGEDSKAQLKTYIFDVAQKHKNAEVLELLHWMFDKEALVYRNKPELKSLVADYAKNKQQHDHINSVFNRIAEVSYGLSKGSGMRAFKLLVGLEKSNIESAHFDNFNEFEQWKRQHPNTIIFFHKIGCMPCSFVSSYLYEYVKEHSDAKIVRVKLADFDQIQDNPKWNGPEIQGSPDFLKVMPNGSFQSMPYCKTNKEVIAAIEGMLSDKPQDRPKLDDISMSREKLMALLHE